MDADEALAESVARTRRSYDEIPYRSSPIIRAHPGRMAAHASWRGLAAPDARRARILEIGCASGGHILPLAAAMPEARFLGVDLSPAQVAAGEKRRRRLGLGNVELRADSFANLCEADSAFDFIVCHGVYSWIPEPLRDELLRVIRERLAPDGVAMVSFNVLPGWRLFQVARDSLLAHARLRADPQTRARDARDLFEAMAAHGPRETPYGHFWRNEARGLVKGGDAYIAHEIFEDANAPETFMAFCDRLDAHGLSYLGESDICANNEELLAIGGAGDIRRWAGGGYLALEQYIDIVSGRTFREALIVRAERTEPIQRHPVMESLTRLHFIPSLDIEARRDAEPAGALSLALPDATLKLKGEGVVRAILTLLSRSPASSRLDDLAPEAGADLALRQAVAGTLAALVNFGFCAVSTMPVNAATQVGPKPMAWSVARSDAEHGDETASPRHAPIQLDPLWRLLLPLTDGTRTRDELLATARASPESRSLTEDPRHLAPLLDAYLGELRRLGLLLED